MSSPEPTATSTPIPTPTPTPWPVGELYQFLDSHNESNSGRVDSWIDGKWGFRITGVITKIENEKVQFHIEIKEFIESPFDFKDLYLECKFPEKSDVYYLNKGDTVNLYGRLDEVGNAVKLKDCQFLR